jgi:hypothetical protein
MNCTFMVCYWKDDENTLYEPHRSGSYERLLRYTLTSALLGDGYYFMEGGASSLWWEDYYDLDLGNPQSDARLDSIWNDTYGRFHYVWTRDFDNATVLCNPFTDWVILEDGTWLRPEDGRIEMHTWSDCLEVTLSKYASSRTLDQRDAMIDYTCALGNPSEHASFAYVWANLMQGADTLVAGVAREFLLGAWDLDTLSLSLRCPSYVGIGTYCLEICVGGPDHASINRDTMFVTKAIDFGTEKLTNSDSGWEGSLTVYPQPVVSSGNNVRMEVSGSTSVHKRFSVRLYDIRGRLTRTIYEGRLEGTLSIEFGLNDKGGESLVPGVYFLSAQAEGDAPVTRKIVLLR